MRHSRLVVVAALTCVAAACGTTTEPVDTTGPTFSVNPTSFNLVTGDSTVITVLSTREGVVRWKTSNATVVTVDTLVQVGDPARVHARGAGSAALSGTVSIAGQTYTVAVPVRVGSG